MEQQIVKVNDSLYRVEEDFVRWFLLIGDERVALIDTGVIGEGIRQVVKSITDKPVIVINTHGDGDHTAGNGAFSSFYIMQEDYENCEISTKTLQSQPSFIKDNQVIDLGNRPLELILIPGHTKGSVAIYDKKNHALFSGDSVQDGMVYLFGKHRSKETYRTALEKLLDRHQDFDVIYPSHGTPELESDYIQKMLSSWDQVQTPGYGYEKVNLHGQDVKAYRTKDCGFFLQ